MSTPTGVRQVVAPSQDLPGLAGFSIEVPADWDVGELEGAQLVAGARQPSHGFRPNVTVSGEQVPPEQTVEVLADGVLASLGDTYDTIEVESRQGSSAEGGEELFTQVLTFAVAGGIEVTQLHTIVLEPARPTGLRSAFNVVASCATADRQELGPLLRDVVETFRMVH